MQSVKALPERDECLEWLAVGIAESGAHDLADQLLSEAHDESERAWMYLGLATGMV